MDKSFFPITRRTLAGFLASALSLFLILHFTISGQAQNADRAQQLLQTGSIKVDEYREHRYRTGDLRGDQTQLDAAQAGLSASYDLFLRARQMTGASWSAIELGEISLLRQRYGEAASRYQDALKLSILARRADYQTKALTRLAYSELQADQTGSAQDHIRQAVTTGAKAGNKDFQFEALDVANLIEVKLGNLNAAADYLNRAFSMSNVIHDKRLLYMAYIDRADLYHTTARTCFTGQQRADVCYRALELARSDYQRAAQLTTALGHTAMTAQIADLTKTLELTKTAIQLQEGVHKVTRSIDVAYSPRKPADVYVTKSFSMPPGSPAEIAQTESMVRAYDNFRLQMQQQGVDIRVEDPRTYFIHGLAANMRGDDDTALAAYEKALSLVEQDRRALRDEQARGTFLEDKTAFYYYPALILLDRKRYDDAFSLFERYRSRAMADLIMSQRINMRTPQERDLFARLQTLRAQIGVLQGKIYNAMSPGSGQSAQEIADLDKNIGVLQAQYGDLEARIARQAPKLRELLSTNAPDLKSVVSAARAGGYDVLYYVVLPDSLIVWHINGRGADVRRVLIPQGVLQAKVNALRSSLVAHEQNQRAAFDEERSRELFLFLLQPVLQSVTSKHLVIIPNEELNNLPFQALLDPGTRRFAGETFAISYAPSAAVLARLPVATAIGNGSLLAIANPQIYNAQQEVSAIGRLYTGRSKVLSASAVNKRELLDLAGRYDVIHLSVHGKFESASPLLSYIDLGGSQGAGNRLTASEMFGLPLKQNSLVVLSACETGQAQGSHGNELVGMVRSLLYAGAGKLVVSSWQVDAASTRLWMQTFYRVARTKPVSEAARQALIAVKSRPEYRNPYYWAPFLMIGK